MKTRRFRTLATSGAISTTILAGVATLFVASAPLLQAAPEASGHDRFPLSVAEMDARRAEIFANVDNNGDGLISAEEFAVAELPERSRGGHHKRSGQRSRQGELTAEMMAERHEAMAAMEENLFHTLDADADGVISREEFSREAMKEARRATMKTRLFERADTDGDGYLSPDEFPPRRMASLDANGDGLITRDELPGRSEGRTRGSHAG